MKATVRERIERSIVVDANGCWIWQKSLSFSGYPKFRAIALNAWRGHRAAYIEFVGPIPEGMQLDHTCHTADTTCPGGVTCQHRRCVNPEHLEPVTQAENHERGLSPSAVNARRTECIKGHPFTPANTKMRQPDGRRRCRTCHNARIRERRARKHELTGTA